jgi:hypothetical protein
MAAAGALLISAQLDYGSIKDTGCAPHCDEGLVDGPRTRQAFGQVLMIAGGAALAVGAVVWIVRTPSKRASIAPTVGGVMASLAF